MAAILSDGSDLGEASEFDVLEVVDRR